MTIKSSLPTVISFIMVIQACIAEAQIILKPDPTARIERAKGIIILPSSLIGSFYLNDKFLTELRGKDTVYIINLNPGAYSAKIVDQSSSLSHVISVKKGEGLEIQPAKDSLRITKSNCSFDDISNKITGRPIWFLRRSYFNITQTSFYSIQVGKSKGGDVKRWFRSFTTVNGFQFAPGFSAGIGISYNNYDVPTIYDEIGYSPTPDYTASVAVLENISFLPVFADIRFHLSSRRVTPFIKFDIGYNILLSEKSMPVYMPGYYGTTPYTFKITGGGVYFSTGLGFRIAVNKLLQIITSVDYSLESTNRMVIEQTAIPISYPEEHTALKYFTFNIGIGFQKK